MGRGPLPFKQSDVVRAVKAAKAAGIDVNRVEITVDGRIVVMQGPAAPPLIEDGFGDWIARRDARAAQGR